MLPSILILEAGNISKAPLRAQEISAASIRLPLIYTGLASIRLPLIYIGGGELLSGSHKRQLPLGQMQGKQKAKQSTASKRRLKQWGGALQHRQACLESNLITGKQHLIDTLKT